MPIVPEIIATPLTSAAQYVSDSIRNRQRMFDQQIAARDVLSFRKASFDAKRKAIDVAQNGGDGNLAYQNDMQEFASKFDTSKYNDPNSGVSLLGSIELDTQTARESLYPELVKAGISYRDNLAKYNTDIIASDQTKSLDEAIYQSSVFRQKGEGDTDEYVKTFNNSQAHYVVDARVNYAIASSDVNPFESLKYLEEMKSNLGILKDDIKANETIDKRIAEVKIKASSTTASLERSQVTASPTKIQDAKDWLDKHQDGFPYDTVFKQEDVESTARYMQSIVNSEQKPDKPTEADENAYKNNLLNQFEMEIGKAKSDEEQEAVWTKFGYLFDQGTDGKANKAEKFKFLKSKEARTTYKASEDYIKTVDEILISTPGLYNEVKSGGVVKRELTPDALAIKTQMHLNPGVLEKILFTTKGIGQGDFQKQLLMVTDSIRKTAEAQGILDTENKLKEAVKLLKPLDSDFIPGSSDNVKKLSLNALGFTNGTTLTLGDPDGTALMSEGMKTLANTVIQTSGKVGGSAFTSVVPFKDGATRLVKYDYNARDGKFEAVRAVQLESGETISESMSGIVPKGTKNPHEYINTMMYKNSTTSLSESTGSKGKKLAWSKGSIRDPITGKLFAGLKIENDQTVGVVKLTDEEKILERYK